MKYDVHLYCVVRVKVCDVEANNQRVALEKAEQMPDLYRLFDRVIDETYEVAWAEEIDSYLVDEVGDEEYEHSVTYDKNGEPIVERDPWEDDPLYPPEDWEYGVRNGNTRAGYLEWIKNRKEADLDNLKEQCLQALVAENLERIT